VRLGVYSAALNRSDIDSRAYAVLFFAGMDALCVLLAHRKTYDTAAHRIEKDNAPAFRRKARPPAMPHARLFSPRAIEPPAIAA